ncbi:MAG: carboxypeptidase-like regulatory domain-containing protein [Rhodothermaceae bacterium]|nr:carboxypeptidase-like regulatory domain-containing protein [Rhodothermaceae bacterium]MXW32067.1 carboxypeptidase-like regulatory domain-containing protein [Rhodothermaceae bacterium]MXX97765.1 carboxypeptidase-like regulatory domain-containing protein [Rhodothermaceae bacterium]MXZ18351.1 carboxypeptidase-like regulatory domain-containing protein [Rhodothermaceae bacterium]MYC05390.1 carboxypeptidase-like regulatory domain-containing protein [Rhodothermaceae bacterium]
MNVQEMRCRKNFVHGIRAIIFRGLIYLLLLVPCTHVLGQNIVLTGTVTDTTSQRALPDAHVFIASSLIGTATDSKGKFILKDVPAGAHRIVVTMLGYEPASVDTLLRAGKEYEFDLTLNPTTVELEEVVVNARLARRWQRRLSKFIRLFLGETNNSALTTIVNPEVLSFTSRLGKLSATASEPLIIENRALGYRLQYYLKEFFYYGSTIKYDGEPSFTELVPTDSIEWQHWLMNREAAFNGSQRHFLLSLMAGQTNEEGFEIHRRSSLESNRARFTVEPDQLLEPGPTPLEQLLTFHGLLEITYVNESEDDSFQEWQRQPTWTRPAPQRSFMELNSGPTLIDETGEVIDPYGVVVYGYYAFERIADKVPKEYRPPDWESR